MRIVKNEQGAVNLIGAALSLPILVLMVAAAVDIMRVPMAQHSIENALVHGAYDIGLKWGSTYSGIDPFMPAGNDFCDLAQTGIASQADCDSGLAASSKSFVATTIAGNISKSACALVSDNFTNGSGLLSYASTDFVVECGVVKCTVSTQTGSTSGGAGTCALLGAKTDKPDLITFNSMAATSSSGATYKNVTEIGQQLQAFYENPPYGASPFPVGWKVLGARRDPSSNASGNDVWLNSYWLVIVSYIKVTSPFGTFSMMGSGSSSGNSNEFVTGSYIVRPLDNVAGIQPIT